MPLRPSKSQDDFIEQVEKTTESKLRAIVADCNASTTAADKFEAAGFSDVYDYQGGAKAWKDAGDSVGCCYRFGTFDDRQRCGSLVRSHRKRASRICEPQ